MENTTRIADLPMDGSARQPTSAYASAIPPTSISISNSKTSKIEGDVPTNYTPINIHPNPYGVSASNPIMENPTQSQQRTPQFAHNENIQFTQEPNMEVFQNMSQQRLPSRDIPQNTVQYSNDEATQPNYIPKHMLDRDYVKDHYDMTEQNLKEYEQKKRQQNHWDSILNDIQVPFFIAVLFFFFQLPVINTFIFKRFAFLSLYHADGNFNMAGLLFKSVLFGTMYYFVYKFTTFISEI